MGKIAAGWLLVVLFALVGCGLSKPAPRPEITKTANGVLVEGTNVGNLSQSELTDVLSGLAAEKYRAPLNAAFDYETGLIVAGKPGRRLDVAAMRDVVITAPASSNIAAIYQDVVPAVTEDQLYKAKQIGKYTTKIINNEPNRFHNIRLTAKLINNTIIEAGQEFSFNKVTGEPTVPRGFEAAVIFGDGGRIEHEVGGGMCQVSSTLYNAALAADLPVTERYAHSQPVDYVPVHRDATTYTDKDLKFINNRRHTLVIRSFVIGRQLTVDLWQLS